MQPVSVSRGKNRVPVSRATGNGEGSLSDFGADMDKNIYNAVVYGKVTQEFSRVTRVKVCHR